MSASEETAEIASHRIDLVAMQAALARKADIAGKVVSAGTEFLDSLASAHGEFDEEGHSLMQRAVVGVQPLIDAHGQESERYQSVAEALAPAAILQYIADNKRL